MKIHHRGTEVTEKSCPGESDYYVARLSSGGKPLGLWKWYVCTVFIAHCGGNPPLAAGSGSDLLIGDLHTNRVLTYSGTYVNQQSPADPKSPHGAWEYHETLIPKGDAKPLWVWLEVGENDNGSKRDEASLHNWVMANQRMAAALKAKGYHYRYVFAKGAGHTDGRVTRQTLPGALEWLWQDYPKH